MICPSQPCSPAPVIWGLLWYPYRLLEQAQVHGPIATAITYAMAMLMGLAVFRNHLRKSAHIRRSIPFIVMHRVVCRLGESRVRTGRHSWRNHARVAAILSRAAMDYLFSRLLLNEKLSLHGYLVIALSLAGAVIMLWQPESGFSLPSSYGDWMGLSAGFMFALSNVLSRKDQAHDIQLKSRGGMDRCGADSVRLQPVLHELPVLSDISADTYLLLVGVGLIVFGLSLVVQYGLTHVPANQAIVIMLFELVVAAVAAYFLTDEAMTSREWIGGAMIISASLFSARMNRELNMDFVLLAANSLRPGAERK